MNGKNDGSHSRHTRLFKDLHDFEGGGAVEAGGRFVEEQNGGVVEETEADGDSTAFSAGEAVGESCVG